MDGQEAMARLKALGRPEALPHMARYGIDTSNAFGVRVPELRAVARDIGQDHRLAQALWKTGVHDARLLATMIADPLRFDARAADRWARDFRSWDLCDQCCLNLYRRLPFAHDLVRLWCERQEEFVRRAAFSLIAVLAVHEKAADADRRLLGYLPRIEAASDDPRLMVRKSVNWALRQIGKRNAAMNSAAIETASRIARRGGAARWVASDALRELKSPQVQERLRSRSAAAISPAHPSGQSRSQPGSERRPPRKPGPRSRG